MVTSNGIFYAKNWDSSEDIIDLKEIAMATLSSPKNQYFDDKKKEMGWSYDLIITMKGNKEKYIFFLRKNEKYLFDEIREYLCQENG